MISDTQTYGYVVSYKTLKGFLHPGCTRFAVFAGAAAKHVDGQVAAHYKLLFSICAIAFGIIRDDEVLRFTVNRDAKSARLLVAVIKLCCINWCSQQNGSQQLY